VPNRRPDGPGPSLYAEPSDRLAGTVAFTGMREHPHERAAELAEHRAPDWFPGPFSSTPELSPGPELESLAALVTESGRKMPDRSPAIMRLGNGGGSHPAVGKSRGPVQGGRSVRYRGERSHAITSAIFERSDGNSTGQQGNIVSTVSPFAKRPPGGGGSSTVARLPRTPVGPPSAARRFHRGFLPPHGNG